MTGEEAEETVILTRRDRRRGGAGPDAAEKQTPSDADEATIVVERANTVPDLAPSPTFTAVDEPVEAVEPVEPDESTVVVDRSGASKTDAPDEATVVASRPAPRRLRRKRVDRAVPDPSEAAEVAASRRVDSFAAPTEGPAPAIYKPRPAPLAPVAPPIVVGAAAPTRVEDPGLPSVAKQGRRWSMVTLVAAAGACVVSVAGLVALGFVVFG